MSLANSIASRMRDDEKMLEGITELGSASLKESSSMTHTNETNKIASRSHPGDAVAVIRVVEADQHDRDRLELQSGGARATKRLNNRLATTNALLKKKYYPNKSNKANNGKGDGKFSSKYRGVTQHCISKRYEAHFWDSSYTRPNSGKRRKGRQVYLGGYLTEEDAARAYDKAAIAFLGLNANLNFPFAEYQDFVDDTRSRTADEVVAELRRESVGFARGQSQYRGVTKHSKHGAERWEARIGKVMGNKYIYLGTYSTAKEAAVAYDKAAVKFHGVKSMTNFPLNNYKDILDNPDGYYVPLFGDADSNSNPTSQSTAQDKTRLSVPDRLPNCGPQEMHNHQNEPTQPLSGRDKSFSDLLESMLMGHDHFVSPGNGTQGVGGSGLQYAPMQYPVNTWFAPAQAMNSQQYSGYSGYNQFFVQQQQQQEQMATGALLPNHHSTMTFDQDGHTSGTFANPPYMNQNNGNIDISALSPLAASLLSPLGIMSSGRHESAKEHKVDSISADVLKMMGGNVPNSDMEAANAWFSNADMDQLAAFFKNVQSPHRNTGGLAPDDVLKID